MDDARRHGRLTALLDGHGTRLYGTLVRLTLRHDVAADLLQELFLRLGGSEAFAGAADPAAFAWRTAINLAADWRRQQQRRRRRRPGGAPPPPAGWIRPGNRPDDGDEDDGAGAIDPADSPLQRLVREEDVRRVLDGLGELTELARACFVLRFIEDLTYDEVARQLGKTPHQVRGACHAAVRQLRSRVAAEPAGAALPSAAAADGGAPAGLAREGRSHG